jgi:hypothetical protein
LLVLVLVRFEEETENNKEGRGFGKRVVDKPAILCPVVGFA